MPGGRRVAAAALGSVAVAVATIGLSKPAAAVPTADALAKINAQRYTHGLPAYLTESAADTEGCRKHIEYMKANGGALVHDEDPSKPGYTPEGDDAGNTGVLASGGDWSDENPWETAPIHLAQTLAPRLQVTGIADQDGYTCMTTMGGDNRTRGEPSSVVAYTYPGGGTSGHRTQEAASEDPYTPGELLGIPEGTVTGPYLYIFFDGQGWSVYDRAKIGSATLTGPGGPVELKIADNHTTDPYDSSRTLNGYTPTGGFLIPVQPLEPATTYVAEVHATVEHVYSGGSTPVSHQWSFTSGSANSSVPNVTPPAAPPPGPPSPPPAGPPSQPPSQPSGEGGSTPSSQPLPAGALKMAPPVRRGRKVHFVILPSSALAGRVARLTITTLVRRKPLGKRIRRTLALTGKRQVIKVRQPRPGRTIRLDFAVDNLSHRSTFTRRGR